MANALQSVELVIDDIPMAVVPNSFTYDEGFPEVNTRVAVVGNRLQTINTDDLTTGHPTIKFQVYATPDNVERLKSIKLSGTSHTTTFSLLSSDSQSIQRSFNFSGIKNNYEVPASADGVIDIEMTGDPLV